jgi:hypothetical protein
LSSYSYLSSRSKNVCFIINIDAADIDKHKEMILSVEGLPAITLSTMGAASYASFNNHKVDN